MSTESVPALSCPKCEAGALEPTQPAPGLAARQCGQCHGLLIDLLTYRQWREALGHSPTFGRAGAITAAEDSRRALLCTRCQRLMTKYRVSDAHDNRLDFCVHCADVWLDSGELALLNDPELDGDLGKVLTRPWQNVVRENISRRLQDDRLAEQLGDDLQRVRDFGQWLAEHPERDRILAYLFHKGDA